jgi:hypothetical protein
MKKTVFVIGAGASAEIKLPAGNGLKEQIITMLGLAENLAKPRKDSREYELALTAATNRDDREFQRLRGVAQQVSRGLEHASSIDGFIDMHQDNGDIELCGKLAIAKLILDAERGSRFFQGARPQRPIDFPALRDTWYLRLTQLLFDGCTAERLSQRFAKVAFVIFNYDRCLEHYLFHSVRDAYPGMSEHEAAMLLSQLEIHHPYGRAGAFPWMKEPGPLGVFADFAQEADPQLVVQIAKQIRTYSESAISGGEGDAIRATVKNASMMIYLGFSFLELNMDLLYGIGPGGRTLANTPCLASMYGESDYNRERVKTRLVYQHGHSSVDFGSRDEMCGAFMTSHSKAVSFR